MPVVSKTEYHNYFSEYLHNGKIGVIDIGSNSIRLVVYDGIRRAPLAIFGDKAFCQLGKGLEKSGKINPQGKSEAKTVIKRLLTMAELSDVVELHVLATAAVRDAKDGREFVADLEKTFGLHIRIISGEKEAKLAAFGVRASIHQPIGLVGDLGGGSLELVAVEKDRLSEQATLPIGALRLQDVTGEDEKKLRRLVDKALDSLPWLSKTPQPAFYAVGGSFRMLGKLLQMHTDYPLDILHNYRASRKHVLEMLEQICAMPKKQQEQLPVSAKRRPALIPAAVVLRALLERSGAQTVVFSTAGIREGYLFEQLSPFLQQQDPLIASSAELAWQQGRLAGYANELFVWMAPLFEGESEQDRRLRASACILSELAWRVHSRFRAEWAFDAILSALLIGLDHNERVALALSLYNRYHCQRMPDDPVLSLVSERRRLWAGMVGTAANLAYLLSGSKPGVLPGIGLKLEKSQRATLHLPERLRELASEQVQKRLDGLGDIAAALANLK